MRTTVEHEDRLRRSLFLGGEWRASPSLRLRFDSLVSTFDNTIREDRIAYGVGALLETPGATATVTDGVVTAGSIRAGVIDNNTEFSAQAHLNIVVSGRADVVLGDWSLTPRFSLSRARSSWIRRWRGSPSVRYRPPPMRSTSTGRRAAGRRLCLRPIWT